MVMINRRVMLAAMSATAAALAAGGPAFAQTQRTRYSVYSAEGQGMLKKYARAVGLMNTTTLNKKGDPRSWNFQWYSHSTPQDKKKILEEVYGTQTSTLRTLASEVWDTCKPHHAGDDPDMFLPWHRMYVLAFENIIRSVLNDPSFTLPYWDYTVEGQRSIPVAFRSPNDPELGVLYRRNRNNDAHVNINAGDPMDKGASVSPYTLDSMMRRIYSGDTGFCNTLDNNLHGLVHVGVGDKTNMGYVPTAAGDPIFWLHHCNIDRIWAGWNAVGGVNSPKTDAFAFAGPDGQRVVWKANDVSDTKNLGYGYDTVPKPPRVLLGAELTETPTTLAASVQNVTLGEGATKIPVPQPKTEMLQTGSLDSATESGQIFVELTGLSSDLEPGALYEIFINLPDNPSQADKQAHYLGTFSFFGRTGAHSAHAGHRVVTGPTFDVTDRFKALRGRNLLQASPTLTIIPVGQVTPNARPVVGSIKIVRR